VLETGADGWPDDHPFRAGIIRWQMNHPGTGQAEIGLDILPGPPEDCWFRVVQGPGSTLHEFPALLLPANRETGPSLLIPAGLFQPGGLVTLRTDDRDHPATLVHAVELGVHFEHIEIRLQGPA
jgi:hypothetical protein